MKACHAAALALVGWYLMVPPGREFNAPFKYWLQQGSFDSAKECAAGKDAYSYHYHHMSTKEWNDWAAWYYEKYKQPLDRAILKIFQEGADHSLCIATDDPRLK
jgi:hypothetical protein